MLDLDVSLLNLEYFPFSKSLNNLKDGQELRQVKVDIYGNPVFSVDRGIDCTIQTSRKGDWYIAFLKVKNDEGFSFFKSFAANDQSDTILFSNFKEWVKDESSGRWVRKDENF